MNRWILTVLATLSAVAPAFPSDAYADRPESVNFCGIEKPRPISRG